jgi:N-acetylglucosamine-6-phosphate deacetylase
MAGYVDLQVNGYAGVDFNADQLDESEVVRACERLKSDGNASVLATVITAPMDSMLTRIGRIAELINTNPDVASVIAGIHVEGPFISRLDGFVGAHPTSAVVPATMEIASRLLDAGGGHVKMMTLAPEMDEGSKVTRALSDLGILMAAGHTDASLDEMKCGIDHGLRVFTHLGNGCPGLLPRHDNIIQRVLSLSDRIAVTFIADGHHVPPTALSNYLDRIPDENIVIVTDAIAAAGLGPGRYEFLNQTIEVDDDGAAWAACRTHFAGCATTYPQMINFLKSKVGATDDNIDQWFIQNPTNLLSARQSK